MKCPNCGKHKANIDKTFGVLPCDFCQEENSKISAPEIPEFWTPSKQNRIQAQRDSHGADILQPWDGNKINREFLKKYPDRAKNYYSDKDLKKL